MNHNTIYNIIAQSQDCGANPKTDPNPISDVICWAVEFNDSETIKDVKNNLNYAINQLTEARNSLINVSDNSPVTQN